MLYFEVINSIDHYNSTIKLVIKHNRAYLVFRLVLYNIPSLELLLKCISPHLLYSVFTVYCIVYTV